MGPTHPDKLVDPAIEAAALTALTVACMNETGVPSDAVLGSSNVYSEAEACLMAWLTWNMYKAFPSMVGAGVGVMIMCGAQQGIVCTACPVSML